MSEYRFSLTGNLPYKDRIIDSVLIQENTEQIKPLFWHILRNEREKQKLERYKLQYWKGRNKFDIINRYTLLEQLWADDFLFLHTDEGAFNLLLTEIRG